MALEAFALSVLASRKTYELKSFSFGMSVCGEELADLAVNLRQRGPLPFLHGTGWAPSCQGA